MRIYYATDLHGSEKCWKKFLAAPKYYQADVIIMGGDITGKFIVPVIHLPKGGMEVSFLGTKRKLKTDEELQKLKQQISNTGQYAFDVTPQEYEEFEKNPALLDDVFSKLLLERMEQWIAMADERLQEQQVRCFVTGGNDDMFEVDEIIAKSKLIENHDGRVVELADGVELLGLGYSNITPWNCPRDVPEEELTTKIDALANQIRHMDRAIFDIHVPPYDTGIDKAPQLNENLQMSMSATGEPTMIPVGSTAVREAILKYQPMLGTHGHIHESSGISKLGNTTVVNPGSEYAEGILRGALIEIDPKNGLKNVSLVAG